MRKLIVPIFILAVAGCGSERRDFTYCDSTHGCKDGYTCDKVEGICRPGDAAMPVPDAPLGGDVATPEVSPDVVDAAVDATVDAAIEVAKDVPVVIDAVDANVADQAVNDTRIVDVFQAVEVTPPDTRVPDAQGSCGSDNDCVGTANTPFCVGAKCVACKGSANCNNDAGVPFCSAQNTCVSCAANAGTDAGCPAAIPVCDRGTGSCVECTQNSDCKTDSKGFCARNKCVGCDQVPRPNGDAGVPDGGAAAVACSGTTPVCVPSDSGTPKAGQCVACASNNDCSGATPICDTTTKFTCGACTSDSDCASKPGGPGICMFKQTGTFPQDGRCLSDAETIYVQNSSGCSGGAGTATSPFCQPQAAINAVSSSKRVIVLSGTAPLSVWSVSLGAGAAPVYVIGRNNPTILAGADIGIHVVSGTVYIRGVTVQGSGVAAVNPGIVVDSGATLGLDRCVVTGNRGGLLVNDGAGFDIGNSVFAQNQPGNAGAASFGGAYLGFSTNLPHRFWFNTIDENLQVGVACTSAQQPLTGCLLYGNTSSDSVNCTIPATAKSGSAPLFNSAKPYHLTASSPCKGFITDTSIAFPPDDIDGQGRPNGAALDCGADQYWP